MSITGGYVYRGKAIPALRGAYVYGDFVTGLIFAVRQKDGKATEHGTIHQQKGKVYQIASFGEDAEGELYLLPLASTPPDKARPAGGHTATCRRVTWPGGKKVTREKITEVNYQGTTDAAM